MEQGFVAFGECGHVGVCAVAEELVVHGVSPVAVEGVGDPRAVCRRQAVHCPAGERLAVERHDAGYGGAGGSVEGLGEFAVFGEQVPHEIDETEAFVEMAGGQIGPIGELGVEVVVVIAFPRGQLALVGGPDALQGDGGAPRWDAAP